MKKGRQDRIAETLTFTPFTPSQDMHFTVSLYSENDYPTSADYSRPYSQLQSSDQTTGVVQLANDKRPTGIVLVYL